MDETLLKLLPEKWRVTILLIGAIFMWAGPYITRGWYAYKKGGGLYGLKNSILFGTNVVINDKTKETNDKNT